MTCEVSVARNAVTARLREAKNASDTASPALAACSSASQAQIGSDEPAGDLRQSAKDERAPA